MATKKKKKKWFYLRDLSFLWQVGIAVLLAWVLITFIGNIVEVTNNSVSPTLSTGQYVLTSRFNFLIKDPARGELVVYTKAADSEEEEDSVYMGRVIGLPGDKVEIKSDDNSIWINDKEYTAYETVYVLGQREYPVTLKDDEYFIICENSGAGQPDSRYASVGNVTKDELSGKILFLIWPIADWTIVK